MNLVLRVVAHIVLLLLTYLNIILTAVLFGEPLMFVAAVAAIVFGTLTWKHDSQLAKAWVNRDD